MDGAGTGGHWGRWSALEGRGGAEAPGALGLGMIVGRARRGPGILGGSMGAAQAEGATRWRAVALAGWAVALVALVALMRGGGGGGGGVGDWGFGNLTYANIVGALRLGEAGAWGTCIAAGTGGLPRKASWPDLCEV